MGSDDESDRGEKGRDLDLFKNLDVHIGEDSQITHTHGDFGTYMKSENLESKMVDAIKRTS